MNFSAPLAKFRKGESGGAHHGGHRKHRGVFSKRAWGHEPGRKLQRKPLLFDLRERSHPGGLVDRKAHHVVGGKYRERPQGQTPTERTLAAVRHGPRRQKITQARETLLRPLP